MACSEILWGLTAVQMPLRFTQIYGSPHPTSQPFIKRMGVRFDPFPPSVLSLLDQCREKRWSGVGVKDHIQTACLSTVRATESTKCNFC